MQRQRCGSDCLTALLTKTMGRKTPMEVLIITSVRVVMVVFVDRSQAVLRNSLAVLIRHSLRLLAREVVTGSGGQEGKAWSEASEVGRKHRAVVVVSPATRVQESLAPNLAGGPIAASKEAAGPVSNYLRQVSNCLVWRATRTFL